ncbi:hypothetical protein IJ096_02850 [Candidatus Saccharibacteria bacterium]|nr:hypothetical protein [Candidatus Saccharibacteria bacterium]
MANKMPQHKNKLKKSLAIGLIAFATMVGFNISPSHQNKTYAADTTDTAVQSVLTNINTAISDYLTSTGATPTLTIGEQANLGVLYKPTSLNAYIRLNKSYISKLTAPTSLSSETVEATHNAVKTKLTSLGFTSYSTPSYTSDEYINTNTNIICDILPSSSINASVFAGCSSTTWWELPYGWTEDFINNLGKASFEKIGIYPTLNPNSPAPEITNSPITPYQYIGVPVSNSYGLFYRTSPTSDWVFFKGTQGVLLCSDFTGDALNAFYGMTCYKEDGTTSTVGAVEQAAEETTPNASATTPNTGIFGDDNSGHGTIFAISAITIGILAFVAFIARYTYLRIVDYRAVRFSPKKHKN